MADSHDKHDPMQAVGQFRDAIDAFSRFFLELPETALVEKAWGAKEVLAHLVFWVESYVAQIQALLAHQPPIPPQGSFDDLNAQAVDMNRGVPIDALWRRYNAAREYLCHTAQTYDPTQIEFVLKKGSSVQRSLTWYLTAEANHIRWHRDRLERQVRHAHLSDIEQLRQTVDTFCQFILDVPTGTSNKHLQGAKEVLARLVVSHESYVSQIETLLTSRARQVSSAPRSILHAQAAAESDTMPVDVLVQRFQAADARLRDFAQTLDPQDTLVEVHWERFSYVSTLDDVIVRVATQIRNLHRKLARARSQQRDTRKLA